MSDEPIEGAGENGEGHTEPRNLKSLARDHAGLLVAGGVAAGALLAFALTPRSTRRRLTERTIAAATAAGEASLRLGRQGAEKLEGLGETIGDGAGAARDRAVKAAGEARSGGLELLRTAASLISALRR